MGASDGQREAFKGYVSGDRMAIKSDCHWLASCKNHQPSPLAIKKLFMVRHRYLKVVHSPQAQEADIAAPFRKYKSVA
jgi:hypothetical protein